MSVSRITVASVASFALSLCGALSLSAQSTPAPDVSGNAQLNGTYNFRHVIYSVADAAGNLSQSRSVYGSITFDGAGNYSLTGSLLDSQATPVAPATYSSTGTYGISAGGLGTVSGTVSSSDLIYGLVSNGVFIGSSTESNFNDLFIAVPQANPVATAASFSGNYYLASFDFPQTVPSLAQSAWFQLNPDGSGGIGAVTVNGHVASSAAAMLSQSLQGVTYTFANGVATLAFPAASSSPALEAGDKIMYLSPDGNFAFGGSATGWDMIIGVRTVAPSATPFTGLQYQAGLDMDVSDIANASTTLAGYYGALNTATATIGHQHINSLPISTPYDFTYQDAYTLNSDGTYSDAILGATYVVGAGGYRIGFDVGTALGINVAMTAPVLSGTGVYLDPQGVVNAASSAPFTAGIAPGEFLTLYGSGLAASAAGATALPFATTLGSVQVLINGTPAPVAFVSPTVVSAIVPYTLSGSLAAIQVVNGGVASNTVTTYLKTTSPGVFTVPAGGIGAGAVLHLDYSVVSSSNPAQAGEILAMFVSGLGAVTPTVDAGAAGPGSPFSLASNDVGVIIDNVLATTSYVGLAPGLAGLYQINFQVPASGIHSGDVYIGVAGPDSLTQEATLSIAAGPGTIATSDSHRPRR